MKYQFAFTYELMEDTISVNANTYQEAEKKIFEMNIPNFDINELHIYSIFELNNELSTATKQRN